jgi:hypothetical protein
VHCDFLLCRHLGGRTICSVCGYYRRMNRCRAPSSRRCRMWKLWWVERCPLREGAVGPWSVVSRMPPARRIAWELCICIIEHRQLHHDSTNSLDTRISSITGKMSQPVVQTIHRDPALLYVDTAMGYGKAVLTIVLVGGYYSPSRWSWYVSTQSYTVHLSNMRSRSLPVSSATMP